MLASVPKIKNGAHYQPQLMKDAALTAISHADHVDIYWTTLIAHLWRAIARTNVLSPWQAEVTVIGVLAAQAIPAYAPIANACKGERLQRSDIIEVSRGIRNNRTEQNANRFSHSWGVHIGCHRCLVVFPWRRGSDWINAS
jgi:hypothetical protein